MITKVCLLILGMLVVHPREMRKTRLVACGIALALLLPFAIFGFDRGMTYYCDWLGILRDTQHHLDLARYSNQSLYGMLLRMCDSAAWTGWVYLVASAALLGGLFFLLSRRRSTAFDESFVADYGLTSCAVLLICPLSWIQSYVFILPVVVLMTGGLLRSERDRAVYVMGFALTLIAALSAKAVVGERLREDLLSHSIYVWMLAGLCAVLVKLRSRSTRVHPARKRSG